MATAAHNLYSNRLMPLLGSQRLAKSGRLARLVANRRLINIAYWMAVGVVVLVVGLAAVSNGLHLLSSTGLISSGNAISGVSNVISTIMGKAKWLEMTLCGLSLTVICGMLIIGHEAAHRHGMRVGMGVLALVALPGILS